MNNIITAKNLVLSYQNDKIIKNASFVVKPNDFVFITGPSGSGKSTLLKSLYGQLKVKSGFLEVAGVNLSKKVSKSKLNFLRRNIGVIFQDYKLIKEWSVERNVMLPLLISGYDKALCQKRVHKFLKHVNMLHKANKYPYTLSGGEQQRVAVARALVNSPIIILADEPTGNLDEYSSKVIWNFLEGFHKHLNATILVVTHNPPMDLYLKNRKFEIKNGKLNEL